MAVFEELLGPANVIKSPSLGHWVPEFQETRALSFLLWVISEWFLNTHPSHTGNDTSSWLPRKPRKRGSKNNWMNLTEKACYNFIKHINQWIIGWSWILIAWYKWSWLGCTKLIVIFQDASHQEVLLLFPQRFLCESHGYCYKIQ